MGEKDAKQEIKTRNVPNRSDRTKDGRQGDGESDRHTRRFCLTPCSQWAVSDPHWQLYGYSPASDGISNSLINQELCYVTLPPPLTHRRENHCWYFFFKHWVYITVYIPCWTIILYVRVVFRLHLKFEKFIPNVGPGLRKTFWSYCDQGKHEETGPWPNLFPTCRLRNILSSLNNY